MPEYDEADLERIMREGLEYRAGDAADELSGTLPALARRRARAGPWLAVAAVLVLLAGAGVAVRSALRDSGRPGAVAVDPGGPLSGWRVESYAGVQLRVPPSWGLGAGPVDQVGEGPALCADDPGSPYVGRPVFLSDMCVTWHPGTGPYPTSDAVWFGSPLDVGSADAAGRQAVTRAVGGQHLTVFTDDTTLREQILGTLHQVTTDANGCPTAVVDRPAPGPADPAAPASLSVCVYDNGALLWSITAGQAAAQRYTAGFQRASATFDTNALCSTRPTGQWVALGVHDADPAAPVRWDIANFDCDRLVGVYTVGQGETSPTEAPLVPATVEPWAGAGTKEYVTGPGPASTDLAPYFRGMLG